MVPRAHSEAVALPAGAAVTPRAHIAAANAQPCVRACFTAVGVARVGNKIIININATENTKKPAAQELHGADSGRAEALLVITRSPRHVHQVPNWRVVRADGHKERGRQRNGHRARGEDQTAGQRQHGGNKKRSGAKRNAAQKEPQCLYSQTRQAHHLPPWRGVREGADRGTSSNWALKVHRRRQSRPLQRNSAKQRLRCGAEG